MKTLCYLLSCLLLTSCGSLIKNNYEGTIRLDNSYQFYTREVYRTKISERVKGIETNSDAGQRKDLLEVQFMLISPTRGNVIYIAMKPDLKGKKYSKYTDGTLNLSDIHRIRLGKANKPNGGRIEEFKFFSKDGYNASVWQINGRGDSVLFWMSRIQYWFGTYDDQYLTSGINNAADPHELLDSEINVEQALAEQVFFKRVRIDSIRTGDTSIPIPADSYLKVNTRRSHVSVTFFGNGTELAYFGNKRLKSTPIPLMDNPATP